MLVFACHVMILSWTTTTPEFLFASLVIIEKTYWSDDLLTISVTFTWFYNWKHCDVAGWNRLWFSPYFLKCESNHLENITLRHG